MFSLCHVQILLIIVALCDSKYNWLIQILADTGTYYLGSKAVNGSGQKNYKYMYILMSPDANMNEKSPKWLVCKRASQT